MPAAGSFFSLERHWTSSDIIDVWFPLSLWTAPLNDYHPEYNATLAFMYGPLVLAGTGVTSDIFVPQGKNFKQNPATFIHRNSTESLDFEAIAADGTKMRMMPLRDVMLEQYVVYFMTAGTKPPQPTIHY